MNVTSRSETLFLPTETSLHKRVSELERSGGRNIPGGSASQGAEVRRICRERDRLKEATSLMEAELIQVREEGGRGHLKVFLILRFRVM